MAKRNVGLSRKVWCVLGLPLDMVTLQQATEIIGASALRREGLFLSTPNLNFAVAARTDRNFRESIIHSDLSIADGMPLIWVARMLGIPLPERVAGSDLMLALQGKSTSPVSIFFFGGEADMGQRACEALQRCPGGLLPAGSYYPGFGSLEDMSRETAIRAINTSNPDILAVALGAKKGQAWIERNRQRLNVGVISHLGAVVNFFAGSVRRAPTWVRRCGLEWLWRIFQESKLWSRYFHDGRIFIWLCLSRVIPYAIWLRWRHRVDKPHAPPQAVLMALPGHSHIKISGHCGHTSIMHLGEIFAQAAAYRRPCLLDLAEVDYLDGAFLGLVCLLRKALEGKELRIINASKPLVRIFYWNCAEFLLNEPECRTLKKASENKSLIKEEALEHSPIDLTLP